MKRYLIAILTIAYISLTVTTGVVLLQGCENNKPKVQQTSNSYQGLVEGCKAHYDPLYCPDWFKPSVLNSPNFPVNTPKGFIVDNNSTTPIYSEKAIEEIKTLLQIKDK